MNPNTATMSSPSKSLTKPLLIYVTLALLLLLLLSSHSPTKSRHRHRRLKLRPLTTTTTTSSSSNPHSPIPFDPIISDIEQGREDRQWERDHFGLDHAPAHEAQPEWEDFMDAEAYINDEERFNVTHRIVLLFPRIDVGPADGFVTAEELAQWNVQQAMREVMRRTQREMELHDKNKDGLVAFKEYEAPSWTSAFGGKSLSLVASFGCCFDLIL